MEHLQLLHLLEVLLLQAGKQRAAGGGLETAESGSLASVAASQWLTGPSTSIVLGLRCTVISPGGIHR